MRKRKEPNWFSGAAGRPDSHADIVRNFIRDYRDAARREHQYYAIQRNLPDAIRTAALSKLPGGKRHPHQRRIPARVLQHAADALASANLAAATFGDLHEAVRRTIGRLRGIGDLTVYDIAYRIGAHLGLDADLVYLHAGTREGARALGFHGTAVRKIELPKAFRQLTPSEIEDCLCIYKADLCRLASPFR